LVAIETADVTAELLPSGVTLVGDRVQVELAGCPEQERAMEELKPPTGVMVTVAWPD
jgi:hypothetical protein